jgi:uncharacterized protein involved in outer membrane biogenesis
MDIGSSRLHGDFKFDTAPAVPVLSGTLEGSRLALVDLGPAFGAAAPGAPASAASAAAAAAPTPAQKSGRVLPEREFDIPSLKAMNANVDVQLAVVDFGTDKLEPFKPLQGRITLQDGVLTLSDLLARTSAGQVQGLIALDSRPAAPKWNANLQWSGIQLDRFVTMRDTIVRKGADGQKANTGYISGALGGNAQLTGTGKSTAALFGSLNGDVRLWVRDGTLSHILVEAAGIDVAQALGVFVKGDDKMPMQCALAQLKLTNGEVVPEVGVIDTTDTTMLIGGDLSLRDESLDLKLTAHPHDFSPLALRSPLELKGTFSDPKVRLQAKPLLMRAGAAAVLSLATPLASLLALVDFKQPERDVCTSAVANVDGASRVGLRTGAADGQRAPKPAPRARPAKNAN